MNDLVVTTAAPGALSPLALFLHADLVVKIVMAGLLLASLWTWTIILGRGLSLARVQRRNAAFEADFAKADDVDRFYREHAKDELPSARVLSAGIDEWRRSTGKARVDREAVRARLATMMGSTSAAEIDRLSSGLNVLATIGSVCPFVGLFGTVWGIMRSFSDIAASQNTSFGAVAPGIAEALFATALGLFAAIPAVIAYNRISYRLDRLEAGVNRFADGFHATLSRELDAEA
ncbi:biopolymer transport protein TolQ [Sphingomonas vulcanisoli]|uniref:Biopolymer transport protein TolQ n=1 Tax=Sphingomonas vulcanisoli TaxID=1658060 RepID=A0ABX0TRZ6_9SPHN|nr:protein TolQ [Sphingomonas vulcanisoli]NIJ06565.1 biopolymer transport protein TolQ [Sphingomonas vulcanisoli]